ncbi:hypothetical protein Acsp03_24520 [Actinomadura sp. NBRC 104412]|uniref:4a-hydroxytetrahydrobiopterin dehydratase n=1 Tax=Actinomadura sp. NBRC 104412 TaxID=3032203 RepID=UPI0024A46132|nr:4a-hydroxytetrahydrobiopterin dehydratase [Actinomadura sp. NBRC 104412]GLZ04986.1 hypothetical protein Acsp03_24520 [Actinomadura sp. NBRC 104412]
MSLRTPLSAEQVAERLAATGWTGDTSQISRTFAVEYDTATRIVAEVARVAVEMEHRPDIDIRWDRLRLHHDHPHGRRCSDRTRLRHGRADQRGGRGARRRAREPYAIMTIVRTTVPASPG